MRIFRYRSTATRRSAFTLIETGLATIIVGLGVTAVCSLLAKGTVANSNGTNLTIAVNLANNVHELSYNLHFYDPSLTGVVWGTAYHWGSETGETLPTYNDIDDFDGKTFTPPIDSRRQTLAQYSNWSQAVTVQSVDPNFVKTTVPNGTTPMVRVTVSVSHLGQAIYSESWLTVAGY